MEEETRRKQQQQQQEAYDEDDDMPGGAQRVQCAQQLISFFFLKTKPNCTAKIPTLFNFVPIITSHK
jgi:hypothetical protein